MSEAFWWGLVGGIALVVGALLSFGSFVTKRMLGLALGFGAGVLISAVAFDLIEEAFATAHRGRVVGVGMMVGAVVFFIGDGIVDKMGGADRKRSGGQQEGDNALGIVLGAVLDGIPESVVLGAGLLAGEGVSTSFIVAVFLSNLPEGLGGSMGLQTAGWSRRNVVGLWSLVALVSAASAAFGYVALDGASPSVTAFALAFAGGAVLTMLADTMIPEAFENGGRVVGLLTTFGFGLAFFLDQVG